MDWLKALHFVMSTVRHRRTDTHRLRPGTYTLRLGERVVSERRCAAKVCLHSLDRAQTPDASKELAYCLSAVHDMGERTYTRSCPFVEPTFDIAPNGGKAARGVDDELQ